MQPYYVQGAIGLPSSYLLKVNVRCFLPASSIDTAARKHGYGAILYNLVGAI